MTNSKKYIFYFKFSFILIIIFFIIYKLATALLSSHPSPQKDTTPVLSPTWEDCLDRLNSNKLVKDIRWDEQTKVCSVLQSVNTDNTNPNTISDSLKKCPVTCPLDKKDNDKICGPQGEILPKPTYWELNRSTGECTKSISCIVGDQNYCYESEQKCADKKRICPNNCNGPDNGKCDYSTGICSCNPTGVERGGRNSDCSFSGPGSCTCPNHDNCISYCNGPRHAVPYWTMRPPKRWLCKCDDNR